MTVRAPSIEALTKAFPHLQKDDAKLIRSLIKLSGIYDDRYRMADCIRQSNGARLPNTIHWLNSVTYGEWVPLSVRSSQMAIHAINEVLGQFGVEYLNVKDKTYRYVNTGDTYAATIIYDMQKQTWTIRSWGDIVERYDR